MNRITKSAISLLLIICIIIPTIFASADTQSAALPTGYTSASDVVYQKTGNYIANWGARGEVATFLSTYAEDFYDSNTEYDVMSEKLGGSTVAAVPNSDLYKALQSTMKDKHSYIISYQATRDLYKYTDCVRNDTTLISSFYSGDMFGSAWDSGKTWNREHTWPNSKGDLAGDGENDIMMLRPTLKSENGSRGNKAYGTTSAYYNPNGESGGKYDVRGDISRVILYQYVRWGCINTGSKYNSVDIFGTDGVIESLDVLLLWMAEDPVDTWEMGRNDAVQSITGTRNVFIDYPEYAWALFGEEIPDDIVTPSGEADKHEHEYDNDCDNKCNVCGEERNNSHVYVSKTTDATTSKNGKKTYQCCVCGDIKSTSTIYKISKVYLSTEEYTYNGKTKKPSVKVYDSKGKKLTEGEDYKISRPSSSKKVGKYKIKVTFKGNYTGTKTLYYTINPKGTKVSSVTAAKKSLKVKISKQSTQTTGYQIQYSTSSKFKSAKTKTISSYKTTSYTIKSLSAKKNYYVRVRTYKTVDGKKYYSDWSKSVKKKTK